jgi:AraC-like DNA-binding protein
MKDYTFLSYETAEALHLSEREKQVLYDCIQKIRLGSDKKNISEIAYELDFGCPQYFSKLLNVALSYLPD